MVLVWGDPIILQCFHEKPEKHKTNLIFMESAVLYVRFQKEGRVFQGDWLKSLKAKEVCYEKTPKGSCEEVE